MRVCPLVIAFQEEVVMFLQKLPTTSWATKDIEQMLSQAFIYQSAFQAAPSHLK